MAILRIQGLWDKCGHRHLSLMTLGQGCGKARSGRPFTRHGKLGGVLGPGEIGNFHLMSP
ncbi:MAG: hypothetical protein MH112_06680 [Phenylobacterium sp.]|uniref:hypothetical protein n=1 Tax=Phenylobacterium sp. TaxID=1871053 RepID=UPI0025DE087F|nr:hypothetical protein [Phenylobacterium sp.]MCG9916032.1 hypothetical protein [Phenylobacterium sp.]